MLIVCPACASRYEIDDAKIGAAGRNVRCASCRHSFFVTLVDTSSDLESVAVEFSESAERNASDSDASMSSVEGAGDLSDTQKHFDVMAGRGEVAAKKLAVPEHFALRLMRLIAAPFLKIPPAFAAFALLAGSVYGFVANRDDFVRRFPETARIYSFLKYPVNLRGLDIQNVSTELVQEGEARVLIVDGVIANIEDRTISVPLIAVSVLTQDKEPVYQWTSEPQRPKLSTGEQMRFRARLVSPPNEGKAVLVRFIPRDAGGGQAPVRADVSEETQTRAPVVSRGNVKDIR